MKQTRMKKAAGVATAVLMLSTLLPLQAMGATADVSSAGAQLASIGGLVPMTLATTASRLKASYPTRTVINGYQTVTVKMLDASGNLIADGADQIALDVSSSTGTVLVTDGLDHLVLPDSQGLFTVTAVNGIATFKVLDTAAEMLQYTFRDVTVPTVPTAVTSGRFARVSSYAFNASSIALSGTLNAGGTKTVTVTAKDSSRVALSGAQLYLNFVPATGGGSVTVGSTKLTANVPKLVTTDDSGQVSMVYTAADPLPINGGVDTIQVLNSSGQLVTTDSYTMSPLSKFKFSASPIAANGILPANHTTQVKVTAQTASNVSVGKTEIFLSMQSFEGGGTAKVGAVPLTEVPTAFPTDSQGSVTVDYTTPATLPGGGQDVILAQNEGGNTPRIKQSTTYTYASTYGFAFVAPSAMSSGSTLKAGDKADLALNVYSGRNVFMPGAKVYLSMKPGFGTATVGNTPVSTDATAPTLVTANSNGQIMISYTAANPLPAGGSLTFTAQDKLVSPTHTQVYTYSFPTVTGYRFYNSPIAAKGTLQPGEQKEFSFIVDGSKRFPLGNTQVYLSIPSTNLGTFALKSSPTTPLAVGLVPVTTDAQGEVDLVYQAPAAFPNGGTDSLTVQSDTSKYPKKASVSYSFSTISKFTTSPTDVIMPNGFLTAGQLVPTISMKAADASGNAIPNTKVYLTFSGAGTATINNGGTTLGTTPVEATTDSKGQVYLTYQAPLQLPAGGTDTITIRTAAQGGISKSLSYTFASVSSYQTDLPIKTPTVIATSGSLQANDQKTVTITVKNGWLPMANTVVYMKLTSSVAKTVLGTATANGTPLDTTLTKVVTDPNGQVVVTYTAANTLPTASSTDTLLIQSLLTTSKSLSLTYNYPRQTLR